MWKQTPAAHGQLTVQGQSASLACLHESVVLGNQRTEAGVGCTWGVPGDWTLFLLYHISEAGRVSQVCILGVEDIAQ